MSQQEFENYLALLTKLLRISPRQRDRVAEEFRAHMEDRLDELLARGLSRDEAIRVALEEFGDAAGLAAQFVSISRNKRRRWLMRLTTASAAAVLLLAAGIITFWPGGNAGPGVAQTVAQDPNQPAAGAPGGSGEPEKSAETTLTDKLNRRFDAEFVETPLKDVVDFLAGNTEISFWINNKKLEEAGVSVDTPITLNFRQIRLSTFLDIMLDQHNLVYVEKDDILILTSREDADTATEVRVYDCRDLLTMPTVGQANPYGMPGMGMPGMPGGGGGYPGSSGYGSAGAYGGEGGYGGFGSGGSSSSPYGAGGAADPAAAGPGAGAFGYGAPSAGVQEPASTPAGAPPAGVPATPRRSKRSDVLPQVVGGAGGGMGGMMPGSAMPGSRSGMGGGFSGETQQPQRPLTPEELKAEQLMNIVTTAVDPDSWQEMGGIGTIGEYNGLIVVRQTARTHTKVEKVLDMLREAANLPKTKTPRVVR